jgi:hypothetical protein
LIGGYHKTIKYTAYLSRLMDNVWLHCRLVVDVGVLASCSSNAFVNNARINYAAMNVNCA